MEDPRLVTPLLQVVIGELTNVKGYTNVTTHFCDDIRMAYIMTGDLEQDRRVFLPMPTTQEVDINLIRTLQIQLKKEVVVVLCSPTGTSLYYTFSEEMF